MKIVRNIIIMLTLCALTGCMQTKEIYTLNPDGSGKVAYEATMPLGNPFGGDKDAPPLEQARGQVDDFLSKAKGVQAWKNVSFKVTDDGKLYLKATAYFKQLSRFKFSGNMKSDIKTKFIRTKDGSMVLTLTGKKDKKVDKPAKQLTAKELADKLKVAKAEFNKGKQMMGVFLNGLRMEKVFRLPGKLNNIKVFTKGDNNSVGIVYEGKKLLKAMEELSKDEAWMKKKILAGHSVGKDGPPSKALNKKMFGTSANPTVTIKGPLKSVFNYDAEVKAAQKAYPAMRKKLGLADAPTILKVASGGTFKSLRVGGVKLIYESDYKKGITPLSGDAGYTIAIIGKLPGAVLRIKEGVLLKAQTSNGQDLMPDKDWNRKVQYIQLSKDKGSVIFNVKLKLPNEFSKSLKEISGEIIYVVGISTKKIDLGMVEMKAGAKGKLLDAKVDSVKENRWSKGNYNLKLKLKANFNDLKKVIFKDAAGNVLPVKRSGYSSWGKKKLTLTFSYEGKFPAKARIIVEMYDKLKEYSLPFSLKNVTIFGKPIK